ncbi:MAG: hypothetical protein R2725_06670 [Solirubrobacterales bacterium]
MGGSVDSCPPPGWPVLPHDDAARRDAFLARLARMTPESRLAAARYRFKPWERRIWARHYPEEVPLVNGEAEWIALHLVDVE